MPSLYADECQQGVFLGIGGFYAGIADLPRIEAAWRDMKVRVLGLDPDDELKWNLPEDHPTRRKLNGSGRGGPIRNEAMVAVVAAQPVTLVCAVMSDVRSPWWRQFTGQRSVRDFYCEGLKYVLQRLGDEAYARPTGEPSLCVVDRPAGLTKLETYWRSTRWLEHGLKAAHQLYRRVMTDGPGRGPRGQVASLRQAGFASGLLVGYASHDDLLQVADCVIGAVTSLVRDTSDGRASDWLVGLVRSLVPKFRGAGAEMFGNGFVLWPPQIPLWNSLQARLFQ
jgi:hypothetical protein